VNNAIYNIIYSKLKIWLTPIFLRNPILVAWLGIIISPVVYVYQDLLLFRTQKLYELAITPQVVYLQKLLNDRYDYVERRITIVDAIDQEPIYFFKRTELKPVTIYNMGENEPVYVYTRGEVSSMKNDFIVKVPIDVVFNFNEMTSLVQTYKLPSKQFKIQIG